MFGCTPVDGLGDDVEVLGRVQRHVHPRHARRPVWPTARRSSPRSPPRRRPTSVRTPVTRPSAVSTSITLVCSRIRAPRNRAPLASATRQVGRVGLAVGGQPDGADEIVDPHDRIVRKRLLGREEFALQVERRRIGRGAAQLDHPVLGARDRHPAALPVAGSQPGLGLEFARTAGSSTGPDACRSRTRAADRPDPRRARWCPMTAGPARAARRRCGRSWSGGRRRWCR